MMMDDGIQMETIFGDGATQQKGILGKLMSAGKRVLTGESLFMTALLTLVRKSGKCPLLTLSRQDHCPGPAADGAAK
jgi:hypothetical protein